MNQNNGNTQINDSREQINSRITNYRTLRHCKRVQWNSKRRFRTI